MIDEIGFVIYKLETNLSINYIFNSVIMAYTVYICIDNISYLNPKIGFIEKPQLLDTNSIIIEKLQNSSLSPIYICSLWLFICFIILNDFHNTKLYNNINSTKIPTFGGGNAVVNYSTYFIVIYIVYNYMVSSYTNNSCTEWKYNNLLKLNNIRKINMNVIVTTIILFIIFLFQGK